MDHVGIVVDDLSAAIEFFVELGLVPQGRGPSKVAGWTGSWGSKAYRWTLRCCKPRTATGDSSW
jgi:catechol 2,3-dioxygenase-like lactoylglutathione lyase family enzyme